MKKTLIALAVLGTVAGVAHAQSNVEIYGIVDTGYIKASGTDTGMGANIENRIGFRGTEDLGGGLKATFELERRFNLNDGNARSNTPGVDEDGDPMIILPRNGQNRFNVYDALNGGGSEWGGAANVGLASNTWGRVRFGRVNNLGIESYRRLDPFNNYSVGAALYSVGGISYAEQLSNTARYDSPNWSGFSFGLSWTLAQDDNQGRTNTLGDAYNEFGNHGWNILLQYDRGPVLLMANYYRLADSGDSDVWNIGGAYKFGTVQVSLGYQESKVDYFYEINDGPKYKQRDVILGVQWDVGPGQLNASYNYGKYKETHDGPRESENIHKFALGYTYNLSKRTSAYAIASYTDAGSRDVGELYNSNHAADDKTTAVQVGMTHRF